MLLEGWSNLVIVMKILVERGKVILIFCWNIMEKWCRLRVIVLMFL